MAGTVVMTEIRRPAHVALTEDGINIRCAFGWALHGDGYEDLMRSKVDLLDDEAVAAAVVACGRLAHDLGRRTTVLREQARVAQARVAAAVLTPDALPDGVEGFVPSHVREDVTP